MKKEEIVELITKLKSDEDKHGKIEAIVYMLTVVCLLLIQSD